ncbi:MAG TPA: ABC transporter ATP-binding protein/permease [Candidatus Enterocloster faecavium]|uniref:ABC transporter ATP-binding protein/permease n=1 Tax=Candidatus Enterocloster faecavium TaxID=2838560 RepID=A0A9D2RJH6_9FIRM|nr:ABC transporter ATP-binding protein/permease [Candidatus Enterocloster faecavium]
MRLILHYMCRYKRYLLLNLLGVCSFALVELGIPTLIARMINNGILTGDRGYIYSMGALLLAVAVTGALGSILLGYCSAKISTSITRDIRNDVFRRVQTFSPTEMNHFGVSSLMVRTGNDAFQIQMFVNVLLRTAMLTPMMILFSFSLTFMTSIRLSLVILATLPVILLGVLWVTRIAEPLSNRQQEELDQLNRISKENLTGLRVIRSFNNEPFEEQRFALSNDAFAGYSKKVFRLMMLTQPTFFFLMNLAILAIFWIAGSMIQAGTLQVGDLVAFQDYVFHAMFSTMLFCTVLVMYPKAAVSARRIKEVLETESIVRDGDESEEKQKGDAASLVFDHVTFVYPDGEEAVIRDISFEAKAGETVALIGSTGSGKSTLVSLIPRFYDATGGRILLNGRDLRTYPLKELRRLIGFIPQKANLFSGTIRRNLSFAKPEASDEELYEALKTAQGYDFVMKQKDGLDSLITEGGSNFSGGQKQRLSIARALVGKPEVYVFDDSFSALDFATDAKLRKALKPVTQNAVTIIVAQRVSTIMEADRILVLDKGEVAGCGTHLQLLKSCPIYYEIAASQLSEQELKTQLRKEETIHEA